MHVKILEGCIACGLCESICPDVFTVLETSVADNSKVPSNEDECREASEACPVSVIQIEE